MVVLLAEEFFSLLKQKTDELNTFGHFFDEGWSACSADGITTIDS